MYGVLIRECDARVYFCFYFDDHIYGVTGTIIGLSFQCETTKFYQNHAVVLYLLTNVNRAIFNTGLIRTFRIPVLWP